LWNDLREIDLVIWSFHGDDYWVLPEESVNVNLHVEQGMNRNSWNDLLDLVPLEVDNPLFARL
jgi:hypothetical protein